MASDLDNRSRLRALREITRPRIVRIGGLLAFAIPAYDAASNQLGLPKISAVWGMTAPFLPLWTWPVILLALLFYGLFEYVRRNMGGPISALTLLDHTPNDAIRSDVQGLSERLDDLDAKTNTIGRMVADVQNHQSKSDALTGKEYALSKKEMEVITAKTVTLEHLLAEIRTAQATESDDLNSFKKTVKQALENTWAKLNQRCNFIDQGFKAIGDREWLLALAGDIEKVGDELSGPTAGEPLGNRDAWLAKYGGWHRDVEAWARLAAIYRDGVVNRVFDTPHSEYKGTWKATDDLFPNSDAVHDYKTFRIISRNFHAEREQVQRCLELAAFASPSMKGRV